MSDETPEQKTYHLILREVRDGKKSVDAVIQMFEERMRNEDKLHQVRFALLQSVETEVQALRTQTFQISDAKAIALQAKKDLDEHKTDHKWWWGTLLSMSAGTATAIGILFKNSEKIATWLNNLSNFGKPPPHP
ncbi:MAG: hypothetical protein E6Q97_11020 [Desulfurellales bacterium]|nr:MAG: hypothetical protein E6Q97_11020 [Desulfurellales bacterium]